MGSRESGGWLRRVGQMGVGAGDRAYGTERPRCTGTSMRSTRVAQEHEYGGLAKHGCKFYIGKIWPIVQF